MSTTTGPDHRPPLWGLELLKSSTAEGRLTQDGDRLLASDGCEAARIEGSILRFPVADSNDESIAYFRNLGGTRFHERSSVPFAMSTLDTPVYHQLLEELSPRQGEAIALDIGGGDGRNAVELLRLGYSKVIVIDAVADALRRLGDRIAKEAPQWSDRLLLIECDARNIPLKDGCVDLVVAVEALCYLNDDYDQGVAESVRVIRNDGRLMVSERDYEGAILIRLLYDGVSGMLRTAKERRMWDGLHGKSIPSRCFTEFELRECLEAHGARIDKALGTSLLAPVLGWLNGRSLLDHSDQEHLAEIDRLLKELSAAGRLRRCNIVVGHLSSTGT